MSPRYPSPEQSGSVPARTAIFLPVKSKSYRKISRYLASVFTMNFRLKLTEVRKRMKQPVWNTVIWICVILLSKRRSFFEARLLQSCVREWPGMISWKSPLRFWPVLLRKEREITWFRHVIIRASFMHCRRHRSSLSSCWWRPVLTVTSRSHPASVMRMPEQTVLPVSSISSIWKWHLLPRKMYLRLLKMYYLPYLQSTVFIKKHPRHRLPESLTVMH